MKTSSFPSRDQFGASMWSRTWWTTRRSFESIATVSSVLSSKGTLPRWTGRIFPRFGPAYFATRTSNERASGSAKRRSDSPSAITSVRVRAVKAANGSTRQDGDVLLPVRLPGAGHEAVHEDGRGDAQPGQEDLRPVALRDEPLVLSGGDQVVVVGDEAHRRGHVGARPGRVGQVEQLAPGLVAERDEPRAQRLERVAQLRQPRPRLHVRDARRAVRRQVAQDEGVGGAGVSVGMGAAATPPRARTASSPGRPTPPPSPRAPGRAASASAPRNPAPGRSARGSPLQPVAHLLERQWALGQDRARFPRHPLRVHPGPDRPHDRPHARVEHGLQRRDAAPRSPSRSPRGASRAGTWRAPPCVHEELRERLPAEPLDARPQADERGPRVLRLQADEPLDRGERPHVLATEQHLSRERRAVELPQRQGLAMRRLPPSSPTGAYFFGKPTDCAKTMSWLSRSLSALASAGRSRTPARRWPAPRRRRTGRRSR